MKTFRLNLTSPNSFTPIYITLIQIRVVKWYIHLLWCISWVKLSHSDLLDLGKASEMEQVFEEMVTRMVWSPVASNYSDGGGRRLGASPPIAARHR